MHQVPATDDDMVTVSSGEFCYHATHRFREGGFVLYDEGPRVVQMNAFRMDRFEVTNRQFLAFVQASGYRPVDAHNFLRHWKDGFPESLADHPVVWVSLEDAHAYARWVGKRLPTDIEWQWAAQGGTTRRWPWGDTFDPTFCNGNGNGTTPVAAHPHNISPFGVADMVGNVWEWIDVVCSDGWHRWCFLRGGSYYTARGSYWYPEGGPQPVYHHHKFLLLAPSLDRCGTIGFRCVASSGPTVGGTQF